MSGNLSIIIISSVVFVAFIIFAILIYYSYKMENNILQNGIETDAVVTKVTAVYDSDRIDKRRYTAYAKFIGDDTNEHEAVLSASINFPYGKKLRVKYLPGKYDYCVVVSQEVDEKW